MASFYQLKRTNAGQFMFNLGAENYEIILTSESYVSKSSASNGIQSVRENSPFDERYVRKTAGSGEKYFVLTARNNEPIGRSEMYSTSVGMETGINAVKCCGPTAPVVDLA